MSVLRNRTIKKKLIFIIMTTCIVSLLLVGGAFIGWEWIRLRSHMIEHLFTQAQMIEDNCKAAGVFEDAKAVEEILEELRAKPSIIYGCVRTAKGEVFATYHRDKSNKSEFLIIAEENSYYFTKNSLSALKPFIIDGKKIGTVCLFSDFQPLYTTLKHGIYTIIIVILFVPLIAYPISTRLQRIISGPILNCADVARGVLEKMGYSRQAAKQSDDESGLLIDAFNTILERIQERDPAPVDSKEQLEMSVRERTAELTAANDNLCQQVTERQQTIEQFEQRLDEGHVDDLIISYVELLNAELAKAKEKLQQQITEFKKLEEITNENIEEVDGLIGRNEPLDPEELESLAEMAKKFSGRKAKTDEIESNS
ncbi:CHASE sensor domain-containing protein [Planctomycetota bacterium]